ncbi:MAG: hypothetical protein IJ763_10295 [Lachnospiraceae bacterium]|nr:hypothetical protein [Lachnospiraceae bacterium]
MSRKIVDLTEYKDNKEDIEMMAEVIPDEILEAYMKEVENDTPDLWSKIETGYEKELMSIDNERKLRKKKTIGIIAATALIALIAVPVAVLSNRGTKGDNITSYKDDAAYDDYATEAMPEFAESDDGYDTYGGTINEENSGDSTIEQNQNAVTADVSGQDMDDYVNSPEDDSSDAAKEDETTVIDESLFAVEIEVDGIVYEISDVDLADSVPENYINETQIDNIYCDYPEETLLIYKALENDVSIYVAYYDKYKLYTKKTENTLSK